MVAKSRFPKQSNCTVFFFFFVSAGCFRKIFAFSQSSPFFFFCFIRGCSRVQVCIASKSIRFITECRMQYVHKLRISLLDMALSDGIYVLAFVEGYTITLEGARIGAFHTFYCMIVCNCRALDRERGKAVFSAIGMTMVFFWCGIKQ